MPYMVNGKYVLKKATGQVVGKSSNPKKYLRTLNAVEHGFKPKKGVNLKDSMKRRLQK